MNAKQELEETEAEEGMKKLLKAMSTA